MRENEIDIAVDLNGYTQGRRTGIFSHRGAPVQVNYLGYPGTMGADYFDYIIADRHVIPPSREGFHSENVVRLPDAYLAGGGAPERAPSRKELGLPDEAFVFCCFNNSYKITPGIFDVWMRLLARIPGSVLWLRDHNGLASRNLVREAERRGVAASRLLFAPRVTREEHVARYAGADLFLDTLPYNAHATALEALEAGLPLLTCTGETFASRVAGSLLHAAELQELITDTLGDYEALAFKLATDPGMLAEIRLRLADSRCRSPLFDIERFRRHIEAAYIMMHARHEQGEPPAGFDAAPLTT
jgi:predicted O-linked N-acetylglucosamine transferase (SPINDLY family)